MKNLVHFHKALPVAVLLLGASLAFGHEPQAIPQERTYQGMIVEPTQQVASDVPDRVLLSWKHDPATSFSVTWRSQASESAVAEFAVATDGPAFVKNIQRVNAETSPLMTNLGTVHMHAATFKNLKPETLYVYRVGSLRTEPLSESDQSSQDPNSVDYAWSEWFQCLTAAEYSGEVTPVSFVYVGDAQNDLKSHWSRLIRESYKDAPRMTFMLHAGDLVNRGNNDHEWAEWFHSTSFMAATIPQLATPGNHEYDRDPFHSEYDEGRGPKRLARRWAQRFEFPENGPEWSTENIYYVDVQGIRIISLDTNTDREKQTAWLKSVLEDNPNRWTIVTHHHPVYSTSKDRDNPDVRKHWKPLYEQFGVDLVLQGHDHSYGRSHLGHKHEHGHSHEHPHPDTKNHATGLRVSDETGGPVYVVSVSGPKMYSLKEYPIGENPFAKHIKETQLYQVISIDHNQLSYEAKSATGVLHDSFKINKSKDGKNTFHDQQPAKQ